MAHITINITEDELFDLRAAVLFFSNAARATRQNDLIEDAQRLKALMRRIEEDNGI